MEYSSILKQLGLTDKQARVYVALLELGKASVGPIAERANVKRTSVYNFIDELVALGVVEQMEQRKTTAYRAVSPTRLRSMLQRRLDAFDQALPALRALYEQTSGSPSRVSYYHTPEQLRTLLLRPIEERAESIDYLWARDRMPNLVGQPALDQYKQARQAAQIPVRVIYNHKGTTEPLNQAAHGAKLRQVRIAPANLPFDATVSLFNDKVSFISSRQESFGVLIESAELVQACKVMFEGLWQLSAKE